MLEKRRIIWLGAYNLLTSRTAAFKKGLMDFRVRGRLWPGRVLNLPRYCGAGEWCNTGERDCDDGPAEKAMSAS